MTGETEGGGGRGPGLGDLLIGPLIVLHFLFLAWFFEPAISTPDANGYLAQARLIAREGRSDIVVESPAQFVGDHWMPTGPGHYFGQYPPGLPALLAPVYGLFGPAAALWVDPAMGSLTLLALYLVVRAWDGPGWALMATVLMAFNPFANFHALGADSHTAVCFFLMWGMVGLVAWERTRSPAPAVLCGICLGMIPTIRYAETLFLLPFAYFVARSWRRTEGFRSLAAGAFAAVVPMATLAVRNHRAFGAFWRTGYSVSGEQTGFGIGNFVSYFFPYLILLLTLGAAAVFVVGGWGMVELCRRPEHRVRGSFLVLLVAPITLLYMAYYHPPGHNSTRFLLPTFYGYAIAAVSLMRLRTEAEPRSGKGLAGCLLVFTVLWGLPLTIYELRSLGRDNAVLAAVTRELQERVPRGSILIAQGGLQQHLDFIGGWRLAAEERFEHGPRPRPGGPPNPRRGHEPPAEAFGPEELGRRFRDEIARWAGDRHEVYWLTTPRQLDVVSSRLGVRDEFVPIATIRVPDPPPAPPEDRLGKEGAVRGGPPPRRRGLLWGGPPPEKAGGRLESGRDPRRGGRDRPRGPARFEVPPDGNFVLVEWKVQGGSTP
ncbi:MAG: hypothetical protein U0790_26475 [Isosphaeraceae bacterium]